MSNHQNKILVVGSLNMDVLVKSDAKPTRGESIIGSHFGLYPGGKGANQAVQAARLGAEVLMFGRVGNDIFGEKIIDSIQQSNVIIDYIRKDPEEGTGMGCVFSDASGDNWIVVIPRANSNWQNEDIESINQLLAQSSLLVVQLEIPINFVAETISRAYQMRIPVILNPSPAQDLPDNLLTKIDTFIVNETEGEFYSRRKFTDIQSAKYIAIDLCKLGPKRVILTLGNKGSIFAENDTANYYSAYDVIAVDSTAAGDAFCGAFSVALLEKQEIDFSMNFANAAGAYCVTKLGSQPSLGNRQDIQTFMNEHKL